MQKLAAIEKAYEILGDPPPGRAIYDGKPARVQLGADGEPEGPCAAPTIRDRETLLRCNKCGNPICMACAVRTPVGYRCTNCVREQQNIYFNALGRDNIVAFAVGFVPYAYRRPYRRPIARQHRLFRLFHRLHRRLRSRDACGPHYPAGSRQPPRAKTAAFCPGRHYSGRIALDVPGGFGGGFLPMLLFTGVAVASAFPQLR